MLCVLFLNVVRYFLDLVSYFLDVVWNFLEVASFFSCPIWLAIELA